MHLNDNEVSQLKRWIIAKIAARSDADSDVLADYVFALVTSDPGSQPVSKDKYVESLRDFLNEDVQAFVDELFLALSTRSFDPTRPLPEPARPFHEIPQQSTFIQPALSNGNRKRSYHETATPNADSERHSQHASDRPTKNQRKGRRGHESGMSESARPSKQFNGAQSAFALPRLPTPPPGMEQMMDPQHVMTALLAMNQAMGLSNPMLTALSPADANARGSLPFAQRCPDYDLKGFCVAGASCPFEHGDDPYVVPIASSRYNGDTSNFLELTPARNYSMNTTSGHRGRGRGAIGKGVQGRGNESVNHLQSRSSFSHTGLNSDHPATTIVVEQIPPNKCDEASVRHFFSKFGAIVGVRIEPERFLAIVEFATRQAARAAHDSPKVIFDNRFVKVYWYRPDLNPEQRTVSTHAERGSSETEHLVVHDDIEEDIETITQRQEEAQRKYEETRRQLEEAHTQRKDVNARLRVLEIEHRRIAALLTAKTGESFSSLLSSSSIPTYADSDQTRSLRDQLARLEEEAKSLGIDPDAASVNGYDMPRMNRAGRGYGGRGRGWNSYFAHRGRGGWSSRPSAVMRLDNRPKTMSITYADGDYHSRMDLLRELLLINSIHPTSIEEHPDRDDTALLSFENRYECENLMECIAQSGIQYLGLVELAWFKADDEGGHGVGDRAHRSTIEVVEEMNDMTRVHEPGSREDENEDLDRWF